MPLPGGDRLVEVALLPRRPQPQLAALRGQPAVQDRRRPQQGGMQAASSGLGPEIHLTFFVL